MSNEFMTRRGVESNPWNWPEEDLAEWSNLFSGQLPDNVQPEFIQIDNVDEELLSEDSEATTILMDIDDDDEPTVQIEEISSTTSTITTLNAINMMEIRRQNLWILQPAINSVYDNLSDHSSYHYKHSTGDYQMKIQDIYNNALLSPLHDNACFVQARDVCPIRAIQASLYHLLLAMKNYQRLKPSEKEILISNFAYLKELITKMEAGFKAQREWNLVVQSMLHNRNNGHQTRDLESIDLQYQIQKASKQCPELAINNQPPVTALFEKYQQVLPSTVFNNNNNNNGDRDLTEKEIDAHRMFTLLSDIEDMTKHINM